MDASPSRNRAPGALFPGVVKWWIWLSAFASLAGWGLSAIGQLNRVGYGICFILGAVVVFVGRRTPGWTASWELPAGRRLLRRFRRPLPGAYAVLALLIFVGASLYPPSNYTGLNYHLVRVLQWLAHDGWFWIHTANYRMNFSGCTFEWLTTPVVLFTNSDRAIFLVNFLPFLLLPGLVFSVFTRLGIRPRVAWPWMWLLPTGYNFLLQSGSIANDAFATVYALAAIDFACRAWESRRIVDLWHSLLAAALMTGVKPTSLPLLLPWVLLVLPLLPLARRNWRSTLPVALLAGIASFLTVALLNCVYTGDWLARSLGITDKEVHQPWMGVLGNAFQLFLGNFLPPLFPLAKWWNQHALSVLPTFFVTGLDHNLEQGAHLVGEVPTEDMSGLGFGLSMFLVVSVLGSMWLGRRAPKPAIHGPIPGWLCRCVRVAAWLALLVFSMKSGLNTGARIVAPYYLLLVPLLLSGAGQSLIVRSRWWRTLACLVPALALMVLVLSPDRPLWPAKTVLGALQMRHPESKAVARAQQVYTIYRERNDSLAGVRQLLPPGIKVVGYMGGADDCDISLWRPFGSRRVDYFLLTDGSAHVWPHIQYLVVAGFDLRMHHWTIDKWLHDYKAEMVASTNATLTIAEGPQTWYLTRAGSGDDPAPR